MRYLVSAAAVSAGVLFMYVAGIGCSTSSSNAPSSVADAAGDATGPSPDTDGGPIFSPDAATLTYQVGPAPATATLAGMVRDFDSHNPIANANVAITGGAKTNTASNGAFSLASPIGRARVTVSATGYVPSVNDIPVGTPSIPIRLNLRTLASPQNVDASGATIVAGRATLVIPAGAYGSSTSMSATWLEGNAIVATSLSRRFKDANAVTRHMIGVLHVEAAAEPNTPATLTVPVATGLDPKHVLLFERAGDGSLGSGVAPTSTAANSATFSIPHFSDWVEAAPADETPPSTLFLQADSNVTATLPDGTSTQPTDGTEVPSDTVLVTTTGGTTVGVADEPAVTPCDGCPDSHTMGVVRWYASIAKTVFSFAVRRAETSIESALGAPRGSVQGVFQFLMPFSQHSTTTEIMLDTAEQQIRHSQTVMTVSGTPCPSQPQRTIDTIETDEGDALVITKAGTMTISAGRLAKACAGCANPSDPPVCDAPACKSCPSSGGVAPIRGTPCSPECGPNPPVPEQYPSSPLSNGECGDYVFTQPGNPVTQCTYYACSCIAATWQCANAGTGSCP